MTTQYLKLSNKEKEYIKKLSTLSGISEAIVKEVFLAMLIIFSIEYFEQDEEFSLCIPYTAILNITMEKKKTPKGVQPIVSIYAEPSDSLIRELDAIINGISTPIESKMKTKIHNNFKGNLDINDHIYEDEDVEFEEYEDEENIV